MRSTRRDPVSEGYGTLVLRNGTSAPVREVRDGDAPALRRLVGRLSERSAYLRYFGPKKELSEKQARRFAEVDGTDRFALVAFDPGDSEEVVAVVRYDREGDSDRAEYAALVEDRFQGQGLGIGLTRLLIEAARERGVGCLYAHVMRENDEMLGLIRSLDLPESARWEDGHERVSIYLRADRAIR